MSDPTATAALQQLHAHRRGLHDLMKRWEEKLPAEFVGEFNAAAFESVAEAPAGHPNEGRTR